MPSPELVCSRILTCCLTDKDLGKTVLASKIIDRCRTQDQSHTAYFYCMHDDRAAIIPLAIYRVVLSQIMHQFPSLSAYFDYERRQHPGPHLVSEKRAQQLLEILAHLSSRQYIIIDGLDECESNHRKIILKFLLSLVQNVDRVKPGCLRLLIVSRNEPDIQQYMNVGHSLGLTAEDNEADIGLYVAMWLKEIQGKFEISNQAVHLLQKRICLRTNGSLHLFPHRSHSNSFKVNFSSQNSFSKIFFSNLIANVLCRKSGKKSYRKDYQKCMCLCLLCLSMFAHGISIVVNSAAHVCSSMQDSGKIAMLFCPKIFIRHSRLC